MVHGGSLACYANLNLMPSEQNVKIGGEQRLWFLCVKLIHTLTGSCLLLLVVPQVSSKSKRSCTCEGATLILLHLLSFVLP